MFAQSAVKQAKANAQNYADDIRYPVFNIRAAVEARLYQLNGAAESRGADEDRQEAAATRVGEWKGKHREGEEVHQFVAALRG